MRENYIAPAMQLALIEYTTLLTAVTTERSQYRPEAISLLEDEISRRNLALPEPIADVQPHGRPAVEHKTAECWLTGICAAIANRFECDVLAIRTVILVATVFTGVAPGVVTYGLFSQFIRTPGAKHAKAFRSLAFWFLISVWCLIPLLYIVLPLTLLGFIDGDEAACLGTCLAVANGTSLPVILVVFCIIRIVRWRKRRSSNDATANNGE